MAPEWALYPMILLATTAAVIASQAIITGSFSLTFQAIQLGFCPRLRIDHTSAEQRGRFTFRPSIGVMLATMASVLRFQTSTNLAAAYGIAISMTMTATTLLFFALIAFHWKWSPWLAGAFLLVFLPIDLSFLTANLAKVIHGGWFPLLMAMAIYLLMSTWQQGRRLLAKRTRATDVPTEAYLAELATQPLLRPAGTAVYMTSHPLGTPLALRENVIHNGVLHHARSSSASRRRKRRGVPTSQRLRIEPVAAGVYRDAAVWIHRAAERAARSDRRPIRRRSVRSAAGELLLGPRDGAADEGSRHVALGLRTAVRLFDAELACGGRLLSIAA